MSKIFRADQIRLNVIDLFSGAVDPSAGGGVSLQLASIYSSQVGAVGSLWQKTGAAATAWEQLAASFAWKSVRDFGAVGDGVTNDRVAIQAAIDACALAGGGVVYFPRGTYTCNQNGVLGYSLLLNGVVDIQLTGAGPDSIILQTGNAASADWSLFRITGAASRIRFDSLTLNGSGVTNPTVGCHLIQAGIGAAGAMSDLQFFRCKFTGMVASSGDGVVIAGTVGNTIERIWISDCEFNGIGRYGVHVQQACSFVFITENFFTSCLRDIVLDTSSNVTMNAFAILGNEILHTGTDRLALQINGPASLLTRLTFSQNLIINGFVEMSSIQYGTCLGNIQTSGVYASAEPAWKMFGSVTDLIVADNFLDRTVGSSAGFNLSLDASGGLAATRVRIGNNMIINEVASSGFIRTGDCKVCSIGSNLCRSTNAGASTVYGIDVEAAGATVDDLIIQGNQMTAVAGTFAAGIRLRVNGQDVINVGVMNNSGDQMDYGIEFADAGAGSFSGKIMYAANNLDGTVGDFLNSGAAAVVPVIGLNGGTFGAQMFSGTGTPEAVVTARAGSMYLNKSGGQGTTLYIKESGTGNTGWLGVGGDILIFGAGSTSTVATAVFPAPGYIATASATELQMTVTRPGTIRNLNVRVTGAGTDAATVTYTVRKNGVDQALTLTTTNNAAAPRLAQDLTHSFTVVAGDLLSIGITKSGIVTAGETNVFISAELI